MELICLPPTLREIGACAFAGCRHLESIELPESLERIGANAFQGCEYLERVEIPEGVTSIGRGAFRDCVDLAVVSLPEGIEVVQRETFAGCLGLKSVRLPDSLRSIGRDAFADCLTLRRIALPEELVALHPTAFDGCELAFNRPLLSRDGKRLYRRRHVNGDVRVPDGVETIENEALADNANVTSIVLPESVKTIGDRAFARCYALRDATMPATVEKLGTGLFYRCHKLETVRMPQGLQLLPAKTFYECKALRELVLPDSIRKIGTQAFYHCTSMRKLHLSDGLQLLGYEALQGVNESSYEFPKSYWETQMEWINGPNGDPEIRALAKPIPGPDGEEREATEALWPYGQGEITENCLAGCNQLKKVEIPTTIETIQHGAFNGCIELENVDLHEGLRGVGNSAFYDCKKAFRTLHIPSTLRTIGWGAFGHCDSLTAIEFEEGIQSIGPGAFSNCSSVECIALPSSVHRVCKEAFSLCDKLEEISLPPELRFLGSRVFSFCPRLQELAVPEGIKRITVVPEITDPAAPDENGIPMGLQAIKRPPSGNDLFYYLLLLVTWERRLDGDELCERFRCFINNEEDPVNGTLSQSFFFTVPVKGIGLGLPFLRKWRKCGGEAYRRELEAFEQRYRKAQENGTKDLIFLCTRLDKPDPARQTQAMRRELKVSEAFLADSSVKRLVLPSTLRKLDTPFFKGCETLREVRVHAETEVADAFRAACDEKGVLLVTV